MPSKHELPATDASLKWAKFRHFSEAFAVGNDIIMNACDDVVRFHNVVTNMHFFYRAGGTETGDGIAALAGHRHLPIFAFSELCLKPRILILTFPDFRIVNITNSQHYEGYKDMRFSETEYLIALSGLPNYTLEIWNWRLGKLLGSVNTGVESPHQIVRTNRNNPLMAAQYAPDLGILIIWEVHLCTDHAFPIKRSTDIPFLSKENRIAMTFGADNHLYLADHIGNMHNIIPINGTPKLLWEYNHSPGQKKVIIATHKRGFATYGSSGLITFLKKEGGIFTPIWQIQNDSDLSSIRVLNHALYGITTTGRIENLESLVSENTQTGQGLTEKNQHGYIRNLEMLYPLGVYVAVMSGNSEIELLRVDTGEKVSTFPISNIVCLKTHPFYPLLVVGTQSGQLMLLSCFEPLNPRINGEFFLSDFAIDDAKFIPTGDTLIAVDRARNFFVISGKIGGRMKVRSYFEFEYPLLDFCGQFESGMLNILLLSPMDVDDGGGDNLIASNKMQRFGIQLFNKEMTIMEKTLLQLATGYTSITPVATNFRQYIATAYLRREFHILDLHGATIKVLSIHQTFNQFPYLEVYCDLHTIVVWSLDSVVNIFDTETKNLECVFFAQNRYAQPLRCARVDLTRLNAISLGQYGTLKCFELSHVKWPRLEEKSHGKTEAEISQALKYGTRTSMPTGFEDKTWLEIKRQEQFEKEKLQSRNEKAQLYDDFIELKNRLKTLIDINEQLPENEQLPLQNFNVSKEWAESLSEIARKEREQEDRSMKALVSEQNRITQWIIDNTWKKMSVQGFKIRGIFSSICCENYSMLFADRVRDEDLKKVRLWYNIENMVAKVDRFQSWLPQSQEKLSEKLTKPPSYYVEETGFKHSASSSETEVQENNAEHRKARRMQYSLSGTSTHNFIEPLSSRYDQLDVVTFEQAFAENIVGQSDINDLRIFFNTKFEELYRFKQDQIEQVKKRNRRLRTIQSELNILAQLKGSEEVHNENIVDPEYDFDEQPERIIKVDDSEVSVAPYISPSRQKLLDEEAYAREMKRLALLADDFRERALITMMDGVLEKRWEDEIKKPPQLPNCMQNDKKPEEYSKDDIRAVNEYEGQLKFLQSERDKYRVMLLEERGKLQILQNEMITKFNVRCAKLFMLKHEIDAAIKQEELKLLRNAVSNYDRVVHKRKEMKYMNNLRVNKKDIESLMDTIEDLDKRTADCRVRYDQLQTRDRQLDRQFKSQFGENATPVVVDQAYKIFKKRPRWTTRAWATASILQDIATRIATRNHAKTGAPIPEECYEFLGVLESLENPANAPNTISPNLWNILCQLRRHKMESEFKLKAQGVQLAEAEATLNAFSKELAHKKNQIIDVEKEREGFRQIYYSNLINRTVQIVMPKGLIEVPLTGRIEDFKGNVLLHTSDIDDINDIIKKAGEIKLRTMNRSAIFRRKIIYKEWEHRMLQTEVKNMQDYLAVIEKCKVTKEVQAYLKRKDLGLPDDLSQTALNREIEATRLYLKKSLAEINHSVEKVNQQLEAKRRENRFLDAQIARINVDVTEQNLQRDYTMEEKDRKNQIERMKTVVERGKLIRRVQAQHAQILELATMLELQRLRTFPTLHAPKRNTFP